MVRLILDSPSGGYPVLMGTNLQRELRNVITRMDPTGAAIVTDTNVRPWAVKVAKAIKRAGLKTAIHAIPAGERSKSMLQLETVLSFLERQQIDRGGCVIAVGGGTVGDLAGLAASMWQRGVRLVAVPTTLLAMVDSSVGGKTGVNGRRSKNAIGSFWQPSAVISDLAAIETLPAPGYRDAFAEVVKYAVAMDRPRPRGRDRIPGHPRPCGRIRPESRCPHRACHGPLQQACRRLTGCAAIVSRPA